VADETAKQDGKPEGKPEGKTGSKTERAQQKEQKGEEHEDAIAKLTSLGLHMAEDVVYALTALILLSGSVLVLGAGVYHLVTEAGDGVKKAIEELLDSLLIVFILVELLSAVRTAIDEHKLVAEPFLLVGILAGIKEIVVLATFRIEGEDPGDIALKIGTLGAVVLGLAVATLVLRRREREPEEGKEAPT
jgi:uncharacterized membrane protein (DUF373 family)